MKKYIEYLLTAFLMLIPVCSFATDWTKTDSPFQSQTNMAGMDNCTHGIATIIFNNQLWNFTNDQDILGVRIML